MAKQLVDADWLAKKTGLPIREINDLLVSGEIPVAGQDASGALLARKTQALEVIDEIYEDDESDEDQVADEDIDEDEEEDDAEEDDEDENEDSDEDEDTEE